MSFIFFFVIANYLYIYLQLTQSCSEFVSTMPSAQRTLAVDFEVVMDICVCVPPATHLPLITSPVKKVCVVFVQNKKVKKKNEKEKRRKWPFSLCSDAMPSVF